MKNKILGLVAVVVTAGLIMAWGCGGKGFTAGEEDYYSGESIPVIVTAGGGSGTPTGTSVTKDIDTTGSGGVTGYANAAGEEASVICEFTFEATTNEVEGVATPVMTLTAEKTPAEMKTICAEADCGGGVGSCGYSPLNCLGCLNEYLTMEGDPPVVEQRDATLYCAGNMPNHPSSNEKFIRAKLTCHPKLSADDVDLTNTWIYETGSNLGWGEINTTANLLVADILGNILANNPALGSSFDLSLVDGSDPVNEPVLVLAAADSDSAVPAAYDPLVDREWTLVMDITAKASAPVSGKQDFFFDRIIDTPISLSGITSGVSVFDRGRLYLAWHLCTDRSIGCAPVRDWVSLDSVGAPRSVLGDLIVDGATLVDVSGTGIYLEGVGGASFYADSIGAYDFMDGYLNVFYSPVTMLEGEGEAMSFEVATDMSPLDSSVSFSISDKGVLAGYNYALRPLKLTINAGTLGDNAGTKFTLKEPFSISFTPKCAATDYFNVDSLELTADTHKLVHNCWTQVAFTNNPYPSDYADVDSAVYAGAISFYEDGVSYLNNAVDFDSAPMFAVMKYTARLDKQNIAPYQVGAPMAMGFKLSNITGFDKDGEMFLMVAAEEEDASQNRLELGIMAQKDATTVVSTGDIDFVEGNHAQPYVNAFECASVDFDGVLITTHAEMMTAVANAIQGCDNGAYATASVTGAREITSVGVGGLELSIAIVVTLETPPTFTHNNAGPVRMDFITSPADGNTVYSAHIDGAATLEVQWASYKDLQEVQYRIVTYKTDLMGMPVEVSMGSPSWDSQASDGFVFKALDATTSVRLEEAVFQSLTVGGANGQMVGPIYVAPGQGFMKD